MPELPEVETTKVSLAPLINQTITDINVYQPKLRWQMPDDLNTLVGYRLDTVQRRAKYLLLTFSKKIDNATTDCKNLIIHLGMSGSLQQYPVATNKQKHDHLIISFANPANDDGQTKTIHIQQPTQLHYHDPRRFGAVVWQEEYGKRLFDHLGVEPLSDDFSGDYLYHYIQKAQKTPIKRAIKSVIMEQKVVVGVGNIYATESLFLSGIHPATPSSLLSKVQIESLAGHIKSILAIAIEKGGSSLKDFSTGEGKTGYFQQTLLAYGHEGEPCANCQTILCNQKINGRASVFCPQCQPLISL